MFVCPEPSELWFKHYGLNLANEALVKQEEIFLLGGLRVPGPAGGPGGWESSSLWHRPACHEI